jgi:hypothetical protein
MESDVKQAFDVVFKKVDAALGNQKAASIRVKKISQDQLTEIVDLKQILASQPELIKELEKLARQLKKR